MDYRTAMNNVDAGKGVTRSGWTPEESYYPNGASASYWVAVVGGTRQLLLSTEALGLYRPVDEDRTATDWELI